MRSAFEILDPPIPGEVTDDICNGEHTCDVCGLYGHCESRLEVHQCKRCGRSYVDTELFSGVCIGCLKSSIDASTVMEYVDDRNTSSNHLWEALFESYFKCGISKLSIELWTALRDRILRDWANDRLCRTHDCLDRLTAFICEDDSSLDDFSDWIGKRKK